MFSYLTWKMKLSTASSFIFSFVSVLVSAHPLQARQGHPGDSLVRTIYQFPNETWVENLAVRANGKILVTLISAPEVWQVDPFASPVSAELVHRFPDATSLLGIAEYAPDVFGVNVGNFSDQTLTSEAGSWSVWSLSMRSEWDGHHHGSNHASHGPAAHKITDIPSARFLNGMTNLPANPGALFLADSGAGLIYSLDPVTGAYSVAVDDPALKPNASVPIVIGVNGIHFRPGVDDYVYFTNTFQRPMFSRIAVDPTTGVQTGPDEVVVESFADLKGVPDDFIIDNTGAVAYIADGALDGMLKVDLGSGETEVLLGGTKKSEVYGQTACAFGRTKEDVQKGTLYITNDGGIAVPPPQGIVGGGVYALDTAEL